MNFNLKFYSTTVSTLLFLILFQISTKAQVDLPNEVSKPQFEMKRDCGELNQSGFIFIGKVKEVTKFKKPKLSEPENYYYTKEGFEPRLTVRFEVERIFTPKTGEDKIKEIAVDVFSDEKSTIIPLEIGESYLVYGTPRFRGKAQYSLEDGLIIYPDSIVQPVSQAQEKIRVLENRRPLNLKEILGVDAKEAFLGGIVSGKAVNFPKPKYPEEAKVEKIGGSVHIAILVNEAGNVVKAKALCAKHQALAKVSEEAALLIKFTPTKISGKPSKLAGVIVYNFVPQ